MTLMTLMTIRRLALVAAAGLFTVALASPAHAATEPFRAELRGGVLLLTGTDQAGTLAVRPGLLSLFVDADLNGDGRFEASFSRLLFDRIAIAAGGGDDAVRLTAPLTQALPITVDGQAGADRITVTGTNGADQLAVSASAAGFRANRVDVVGMESLELAGLGGADRLAVQGTNAVEVLSVAAAGGRVRLVGAAPNVTVDLDDIERLAVDTLGGRDEVVVGDVTGADLTEIDLSAERVTVLGGSGEDKVAVAGAGEVVEVTGLTARVVVRQPEATERLAIDAGAGNDQIDASNLDPRIGLVLVGGDGDDVLTGGVGPDVLLGNSGDDILVGNAGDDVLDGGVGDDVLIGGAGDDVFLGGEVVIQN